MKKAKRTKMNKKAVLIIMLVMTCLASVLYAQYADEERALFDQYRLPATATPDSVLTEKDSIMYQGDSLFTGITFSRFPDGRLQHVSPYQNGRKHGTTFVWYADGKPQLMATYRNGYLNGRFKGWYQFGAVIYDLNLRDGKYSGDVQYDSDTTRAETTTDSNEQSSDAKASGGDQ
jgi:hypothetical protein